MQMYYWINVPRGYSWSFYETKISFFTLWGLSDKAILGALLTNVSTTEE